MLWVGAGEDPLIPGRWAAPLPASRPKSPAFRIPQVEETPPLGGLGHGSPVTEKPQFDPAEVIAAWAMDPVAFVRQAFDAEPEAWQAKALEAVVTQDRVAIRSGHGVGKTTFWPGWRCGGS